jgi:nicotinamidase-related amidase
VSPSTRDCFLAVDVFGTFEHDDGAQLLSAFRERAAAFAAAWEEARTAGLPVVYANDSFGDWHGNAQAIVEEALSGADADGLRPLVPRRGDAFVVKPRYSAFDLTPLELILSEAGIERVLLAGMATEMCVAQTAIDARERGLQVTVVTSACASADARVERVALEYLEAVTGTMLAESVAAALAV